MQKNFVIDMEKTNIMNIFDFYGYDFITRKSNSKVTNFLEPLIFEKFKREFKEEASLLSITFVGEWIESLKMFRINSIKRVYEIWDDEDQMWRENPCYDMDLDLRIYQ